MSTKHKPDADKAPETDAEKPSTEKKSAAPIKVRATAPGLYGQYREPGEEFVISGEKYPENHKDESKRGKVKAFSEKWMEQV